MNSLADRKPKDQQISHRSSWSESKTLSASLVVVLELHQVRNIPLLNSCYILDSGRLFAWALVIPKVCWHCLPFLADQSWQLGKGRRRSWRRVEQVTLLSCRTPRIWSTSGCCNTTTLGSDQDGNFIRGWNILESWGSCWSTIYNRSWLLGRSKPHAAAAAAGSAIGHYYHHWALSFSIQLPWYKELLTACSSSCILQDDESYKSQLSAAGINQRDCGIRFCRLWSVVAAAAKRDEWRSSRLTGPSQGDYARPHHVHR